MLYAQRLCLACLRIHGMGQANAQDKYPQGRAVLKIRTLLSSGKKVPEKWHRKLPKEGPFPPKGKSNEEKAESVTCGTGMEKELRGMSKSHFGCPERRRRRRRRNSGEIWVLKSGGVTPSSA